MKTMPNCAFFALDPGKFQPDYDPNGNTTKFPAALKDDFGVEVRAVFDAWNRLVRLVDDQENTLAEYAYDALHRRIVRKKFDGGTLDATCHDYFTPAWQLAEVRQDGLAGDGIREQYLWDAAPSGYLDCLVLRDRDTNDDGNLDERLYAQQDAIYNVSSVLDTSGDVQERYIFDPYGTRSILDPGFNPRTASDFDWRVGSQGLVHDPEAGGAGLIYTRFRYRHPTLGRWVTRDPLGYVDRLNLYGFVGNNGVNYFDSLGLQTSGPANFTGGHISVEVETQIYDGRVSGDFAAPPDGYNAEGRPVRRVPLSNRYRTADGQFSESPVFIPTNKPNRPRNGRAQGVGRRTPDQNVSSLTRTGAAVSALPMVAEGFNFGVNSAFVRSALNKCRDRFSSHTDPLTPRIEPPGDWRYGTQYRDLSEEFWGRL